MFGDLRASQSVEHTTRTSVSSVISISRVITFSLHASDITRTTARTCCFLFFQPLEAMLRCTNTKEEQHTQMAYHQSSTIRMKTHNRPSLLRRPIKPDGGIPNMNDVSTHTPKKNTHTHKTDPRTRMHSTKNLSKTLIIDLCQRQ